MKHVSMLPPRVPAYQAQLEQRKRKWAEQERHAAKLEMDRVEQLERLRSRAPFWWKDQDYYRAVKDSPWRT